MINYTDKGVKRLAGDDAVLRPYRQSLAGSLLAAREAAMCHIRPVLRLANVTEQQWRVLRILVDEGSQDPSRLAGKAMLLPPSVTRILKELRERHLISRVPDPADKRRSIIAASDEGRRLIAATADQIKPVLHMFEEIFGQGRLDGLIRELQAFAVAVDPPGTREHIDGSVSLQADAA
jgi:homoprotocatechuate degradation regulator HpaR